MVTIKEYLDKNKQVLNKDGSINLNKVAQDVKSNPSTFTTPASVIKKSSGGGSGSSNNSPQPAPVPEPVAIQSVASTPWGRVGAIFQPWTWDTLQFGATNPSTGQRSYTNPLVTGLAKTAIVGAEIGSTAYGINLIPLGSATAAATTPGVAATGLIKAATPWLIGAGVGAAAVGILGALGGSKTDQTQGVNQNPLQGTDTNTNPVNQPQIFPDQSGSPAIDNSPGATIWFDQRQSTTSYANQYTSSYVYTNQGTSAEQQQTASSTNWGLIAAIAAGAFLLGKK